MLSNYFNITVTLEWITFFAAIILLNISSGRWRLFIPWLFFILCTETFGWFQYDILKVRTNAEPFNVLLIIRLSFLLWILAQAVQMHTLKNKIHWLILYFIVFGMVNLLFFQKFKIYNYITEIVGDILLVFTCGFLIFQIIIDEQEERSLFTQDYFWLATGVLFSAMGSAVLYTFLNELQEYKHTTGINVYGYINYTINSLFYACLIIAFIFRRKNMKLQQNS